jgi:hypothetical protein
VCPFFVRKTPFIDRQKRQLGHRIISARGDERFAILFELEQHLHLNFVFMPRQHPLPSHVPTTSSL